MRMPCSVPRLQAPRYTKLRQRGRPQTKSSLLSQRVEQAARLVAVAAEQGINLIDTADAYSQGKSEEVVGQVLSDLGLDETRVLVATKVRLGTGPGPHEVGLGRSHIMRSVERSLKRIGRDHIH